MTNLGSAARSQCPASPRSLHFLVAHGASAPYSLLGLARHIDPDDPLDPEALAEHADLDADLVVRGLQYHTQHRGESA